MTRTSLLCVGSGRRLQVVGCQRARERDLRSVRRPDRRQHGPRHVGQTLRLAAAHRQQHRAAAAAACRPCSGDRRKASVAPSGDQRGARSRGPAVSGRGAAPPPSRPATARCRSRRVSSLTVTRTNATAFPSGEIWGSAIQTNRNRSSLGDRPLRPSERWEAAPSSKTAHQDRDAPRRRRSGHVWRRGFRPAGSQVSPRPSEAPLR